MQQPLPSFQWHLLAFSPNGNLLAFGGKGLGVLNMQQKTLSDPAAFGGAREPWDVMTMAFTEDGKYLLAGESDGRLRAFTMDGREVTKTKVEADHGRHLVLLPLYSHGAMNDASMMPDQKPSPGHPERFDLPPNLQTLATTTGPNGETLVATGGYEGVGRLWKLDAAKLDDVKLTLLKEFNVGAHITHLAMAVRNGRVLVAFGDMSGKLQIWDQEGQHNVPYSFSDSISAIAFHPKSDYVAASGMDGAIRFVSFSGVTIAPAYSGLHQTIHALQFFPDGNRLVAGCNEGVRLIDMDTLGGSRRITAFDDFQNERSGKIVGAAFLQGSSVVAGTEAGDLYFYNREADAARHVQPIPTLQFHRLAANRQGTLIAAAGNDGRIHLYDSAGTKTGELRPFHELSQPAEHLVFSDDGKSLATDYPDGTILVWDLEKKQQKAAIPRQAEQHDVLHLMAFTPTGDLAAIPVNQGAAAANPVLRLFHFHQDGSLPKVSTIALIDSTTGARPDDITALAFRRDGKGFHTGHADGVVEHWAMDGKSAGTPIQLTKSSVLWIASDTMSERLVLAGKKGLAAATDPVPGGSAAVETTASLDLQMEINSVALSVEEDAIVTVDESGVRIWPANWLAFLRESCERLRHHPVFTNNAQVEGLDQGVIDPAKKVCQEQVWKK